MQLGTVNSSFDDERRQRSGSG